MFCNCRFQQCICFALLEWKHALLSGFFILTGVVWYRCCFFYYDYVDFFLHDRFTLTEQFYNLHFMLFPLLYNQDQFCLNTFLLILTLCNEHNNQSYIIFNVFLLNNYLIINQVGRSNKFFQILMLISKQCVHTQQIKCIVFF